MVKKILVAMSTILILVSCLFSFSVSASSTAGSWLADDGGYYLYDYSQIPDFLFYKKKKPFVILTDGIYSDKDPKSTFRMFAFEEIPTLFYDEINNIYYFDSYDTDDTDKFIYASAYKHTSEDNDHFNGGTSTGLRYIYFNDFSFSKMKMSKNNSVTDEDLKDSYIENIFFTFVPIFDESVPESAKYELLNLLDDDGWDDYYNNVIINVTPDNNTWRNMTRLRTPPPKNSPFLREDKQNDPNSLINPSPNLYYFTVNITNKGDEPFTFVMTANEKNYMPGKSSVSMSEASSDIKNIFNVNGSVYITVPGNSTFEYNFNFEEIDHKSTKDSAFGVPQNAPDYSLFINFWSKTPGRVTGDNWIKLEDFPGDPSSYGFEDFRSCFSHDFSFKGYWAGGSKKPDNYKDIIKDNPIADLTLDGAYGSVDFDLNPSIDDFKSMIDNSKGFLEFVRYAMANFVPSFFWVIIAAGLTGIVVLRILGR